MSVIRYNDYHVSRVTKDDIDKDKQRLHIYGSDSQVPVT